MKILLANITYEGMRYCRKEFIQHISELDGDFDTLFVTNSGEEDKKLLEEETKVLRNVTILVNEDVCKTGKDQVVSNRNLVRKYFLEKNYDYLYFKDGDVFGPNHQLTTALSHNKKLVTGYYMMLMRKADKIVPLPMVYVSKGEGKSMQLSMLDVIPPRFFEISFAGLGCTLIAREVLEKVSFRKFENSTEDTAFYEDARKQGYKLYLDTRIKCPHQKWLAGDKRNAYLNPNNYQMKKK